MQKIVQELRDIIREYSEKINAIPNDDFYSKPLPTKWSKIEVLGHLADSAQNNLRRFLCGQYETSPPWIVYNQDFWVHANHYQTADKNHIIQLWSLLNGRIGEVLLKMPAANYQKQCNSGRESEQLHTLQWFAEDYIKHLKHHLNQILPGSFDIIYR